MSDDDQFEFIEKSQKFVSALTGVKQQFIDAGWSEPAAERAAISMIDAAGRSTQHG